MITLDFPRHKYYWDREETILLLLQPIDVELFKHISKIEVKSPKTGEIREFDYITRLISHADFVYHNVPMTLRDLLNFVAGKVDMKYYLYYSESEKLHILIQIDMSKHR